MNIFQRILCKLLPICRIGKYNVIKIGWRNISYCRTCVYGNNNTIDISQASVTGKLRIYCYGDNNTLTISPKTRIIGSCKITLMGNSSVRIGEKCGVRDVYLVARDGKIEIGNLVMFSNGINIRNTDSHRIYKMDNPDMTINGSKDIKIGNHVWVGMNSTILKGVTIGNDSIIGFGSIITHDCPPNSVMAGTPAKVVQTGINWDY